MNLLDPNDPLNPNYEDLNKKPIKTTFRPEPSGWDWTFVFVILAIVFIVFGLLG